MGLRQFGEEIWLADGPVVSLYGFRYPTRMAVIRLDGGQLFVWSPVALDDAMRAAVATLGTVRWVVAPNTLHDRFLADWQRAYPDAALLAPPGLAERRPDLRFDGTIDGANAPWGDEIAFEVVAGNRITTEVVFFHRRSHTILFCDLLQQFDQGWFGGWRALVARLDGMTSPEPRVPRKFRVAFSNRGAAWETLRRVLDWPSERLVMAHGAPLDSGAREAVQLAFRWLLRY